MAASAHLKIELPDGERGRSEFDIKDLDRINARLTANAYRASGGVTAAEKREADLVRRDELERRPQARADQQWQRDSQAETEALAAGRGEQVAADKAGVKRILDRDPLLSLVRAGAMSPDQLEAGLAVRELYEIRRGDAASVEFDGAPGAAHDHERFIANRYTRAKTTLPVGQLETALLSGHFRLRSGALCVVRCWPALKAAGMEPHVTLHALRWVCCENNTLTSMGRGRAYERNRKALCWALDVAGEVLDARTGAARAKA